MPANKFSISGNEINSYEFFKTSIRNNNISNVLYIPDMFTLSPKYDKYTKITFRAVSFKNTRFERIKFVDCVFIDCLFLNADFFQCE